MSKRTTYSEARAKLAQLWDEVVEDRVAVIISRRGSEDVALVAAAELQALMETAHLLSSPVNAARLHTALERAKAGTESPQTVDALRAEVGLDGKT